MLLNPLYVMMQAELNALIAVDAGPLLERCHALARMDMLLRSEAVICMVNQRTGAAACGQQAILWYHGNPSIPYTWWLVDDSLLMGTRFGWLDSSDLCHWHDMGRNCVVIGSSGDSLYPPTLLLEAWLKTLKTA